MPSGPTTSQSAAAPPFWRALKALALDAMVADLRAGSGRPSLLGGEISVSSKPGVGTSFEVTLPYWPGEPASVTRPAAERPREQRAA